MANMRRRRGASPKLTRWYERHALMMDGIDSRDPQLMSFKFNQFQDDRYDEHRDDEQDARDEGYNVQPYPEDLLIAAALNPHANLGTQRAKADEREERERLKCAQIEELEAAIRNRLSEDERHVLEMRCNNENFGGARVLKYFTIRSNIFRPRQYLSADEVHNIAPMTRRALQEQGYLEIYARGESAWRAPRPRGATPQGRPSLKYKGQATFADIAKALGLSGGSAARQLERSAVLKLQKCIGKYKDSQ